MLELLQTHPALFALLWIVTGMLVLILIGFLVGIGLSFASHVLTPRVTKLITYDNLDKLNQ